MKRVLILDENEDIRTILSLRIMKKFAAEVVAKPLKQARQELERSEFSLVISDVEESNGEGFWLHRFLLENHPKAHLILFISERRMLRDLPMLDSVLRGRAMKFEYGDLDMEITKLKILEPLTCENTTGQFLRGGQKC